MVLVYYSDIISILSKRLYSNTTIWGNMDIDETFSPHEIVYGLYLGSAEDAESMLREGTVDMNLDVRERFHGYPSIDDRPVKRRTNYGDWNDFCHIHAKDLDELAIEIHNILKANKRVIVHCHGGIERSPLVVAWFLVTYDYFPDLECAYRYIIEKHPIARKRGQWVDWREREERGMFGRKT